MNYIRHLSAVFDKMDTDLRLTPFHISLYMALFRCWNANYFKNPVSISRDEMMKISKIGSVNTYTKSLKELNEWGYIKYEPSYYPHKGSQIYLYSFDNGSDKGSEIALRPYINNINNTNETNLGEQALNFKNLNVNEMEEKKEEKEKLRQKKKNLESQMELVESNQGMPPDEIHVNIYFEEKGFPNIEAQKFYNYFQSNGWLVGGKAKMKDWKAAARNWMLNAQKFNAPKHEKSNKLHTNPNKDYSEPL